MNSANFEKMPQQHIKKALEKNFSDPLFLADLGFILVCLIANTLFPAKNPFQAITRSAFFLVLLPLAYNALLRGRMATDSGWNLSRPRIGLLLGSGALLLDLSIFFALTRISAFQLHYLDGSYTRAGFQVFLLHELFFSNLNILIITAFFQGFVISSLRKKLGEISILVQSSIFILLLILTRDLSWSTLPFIILSFSGGFLAYQTRSFFYSYLVNFFAIIILDAYIIHLVR